MRESPDSSADQPLRPGDQVLDRYRVIEQLETGGTSIVYRAEDERLARPVCIKVFHHLTNREGIYRTTYEHFVQEAFALSKLTHPNTLRIYDFGYLPPPEPAAEGEQEGERKGAPFQVSEFMSGGTLADRVFKEGPLPREDVADVIRVLAEALAEAHSVGLIHRDIKPKNILFGRSGRSKIPKLADFGIAKAVALEHDRLSHQAGDTQIVAGAKLLLFSGLWAAPEQLIAEPVDPSTDIYSLALVAVYALTGRCVFSQQTARQAYGERVTGPTRIAEIGKEASFSPATIALLQDACNVVPRERPQDVADFGLALAELLNAPAIEITNHRTPSGGVTLPDATPPVSQAPHLPGVQPHPHPPFPAHTVSPQQPQQNGGPPPPMVADPTGQTTEQTRATDPAAERVPPELKAVPTRDAAEPAVNAYPGPPLRLAPSAEPQQVDGRVTRFLPTGDGSANVVCAGGRARFRVSLMHYGTGQLAVHVRGLNCFIRKAGGRPTGGVNLNAPGLIELVEKNLNLIARFRVLYGSPAAGHRVFKLDSESVAVRNEDCPGAIALDFGPGADLYFVYLPDLVAFEDTMNRNTNPLTDVRRS